MVTRESILNDARPIPTQMPHGTRGSLWRPCTLQATGDYKHALDLGMAWTGMVSLCLWAARNPLAVIWLIATGIKALRL